MRSVILMCHHHWCFYLDTLSLERLLTKAKESPLPMRQTNLRQMSAWYFMVSGRAYRYYTLLKGDLKVVVAKGNLINPRRNSTTGCRYMSYAELINFSVNYFDNTLPNCKNLCRWAPSQSSNCSFCLQSETLQHVSSCKSYLDEGRYTWRHNSVLLFLANAFSSLKQCTAYADLPSFLSPCFITGELNRPDLLLL